MTTKQYLAALHKLGLSHVGAARVIGLSPRQAQRIASGHSPVPEPIAKLLRLMLRFDVKPVDLE